MHTLITRTWRTRLAKAVHVLGITALLINTMSYGLVAFARPASAATAIAGNLDQCKNGGAGDPAIDPCDWVNGNLNSNQAHYLEGESVPYRLVMTDLPLGVHTVTIGYDIKHSDKHAIDYLTSYDRIAESVAPCDGVACGAPSTFPIPIPTTSLTVNGLPQPQTSFNALPASERLMTVFNGSISSIAYASEGDLTAAQDATTVTITLTATSSTVVLAWGGHIGSRIDWGFTSGVPNSAGGINGSPYHMRLDNVDGTGGNQDRSLQAGAVTPPASIIVEKQTLPDGSPQAFTFTGDAAGSISDGQQIVVTGLAAGTYTTTEQPTSFWSLAGITCSDTDSVGDVGTATATFNVSAGETVTCTFANTELPRSGTLTVTKVVDSGTASPDDFGFTIAPDPNGVGTVYPSSGTYTFVDLPADTYTVTELPLSGYHQVSSTCDDVAVTAGQDASCVIHNARDTGTLTINKSVDADGNGTFEGDNTAANTLGFRWGLVSEAATRTMGSSATLPTANYDVTENSVANYHFVGWFPTGSTQYSCANPQGTTLPVNVSVAKDQPTATTLCNARNTGDLTVIKIDEQNNRQPNVEFTVNGQAYFTDGNGEIHAADIPTGDYAVEEITPPTGYSFLSVSGANCTNANPSTATVATNQTTTCTFTNSRDTGTIVVHKDVVAPDGSTNVTDGHSFTVQLNGGDSQPITESTTVTYSNLPTDTYTIGELPDANYALVSITNGGSIDVAKGQTTHVYVVNKQTPATIRVSKDVVNPDGGPVADDHGFTATLTGDFGTNLTNAIAEGAPTSFQVWPGSYTVGEQSDPNYTLVGITPNANVNLTSGASTDVLITNAQQKATLTVSKDVVAPDGVTGVADTHAFSVTLSDGQDDTIAEGAPAVFLVNPGDITATEASDPNYVLVGYAPSATVSVGSNGQASITITNKQLPATITLIKDVRAWDNSDVADATSFDVMLNGETKPFAEGSPATFTVDPGTYTAVETGIPADYLLGTYSPSDSATVGSNGQATITVTNLQNAHGISLDKWDDVDPVQPGQQITYTIAYANTGNAPVTNATIADPVPTNTTFVSATNGGTASAGTVTWNLGELLPGANGTVAMTVAVTSPLGNGTIIHNVATFDTSETDAVQADEDTLVVSSAVLAVVKSDNPDPVQAGGSLTYTLHWSVTGTAPVTSLTLTDDLPSDVSFVSASNGGTYDGINHRVTWALPAANPGDNGDVTVTTQVASPLENETIIWNYAMLCGTAANLQLECRGDNEDTTVLSDFNVEIVKLAASTVDAGDQLTYTLNWSATGNTPIANLVITDPLPANTTFVSATNGGSEAAGTVTWNLGFVIPTDSGSVQFTVAVASPLTNGTVITNTGTLCGTGAGESGVEHCDDDTTTTTVESAPIISLTKTDVPDPVQAGGILSYELTWTVGGNAPATDLTLVDPLPADVTYLSATGTPAYDAPSHTLTWDLGTKFPNDSGVIGITVLVASPLANGTVLTNTATLDSAETDPFDATARTLVESSVSPSLTKIGPSTVVAGNQISYSLAWSIQGNDPATDLIVTDTVPANTTFVSASCGTTAGTCSVSENAGLVTWNLGNRNPEDGGTLGLTVATVSPLANGTVITNTGLFCLIPANIFDQRLDAVQSEGKICDDGSTTTTVVSAPTITLTKGDAPDPVAAGGTLTYTLNWGVAGNAPATNLTLTDPLPTNTTFVSASDSGVLSGNTVTWALGTQNPGASGAVTLVVRVASPIANGTVLTNTATLDSAETDFVNATATTTVASAPSLTITKTSDVTSFTTPGLVVTYTITVTNAVSATDSAHNVVVTDTLPVGFTTTDGKTTVTFPAFDLAPGASKTLTVTAVVGTTVTAGTYTNTATAKGDNTTTVVATADVPVRVPQVLGLTSSPELTITKEVNTSFTNPGKTVRYSVTVENIGNDTATNVFITDTLPDGFSFVDGIGSEKTFSIGDLAPGHKRSINYEVLVTKDVKAGTYTNLAIAQAENAGPVQASVDLDVRTGKVLAATGTSLGDYLIALIALAAVGLGTLLLRRRNSVPENA